VSAPLPSPFLNVERRRRLERCEVPAKPNDLNALQKLLFYLASSRFPHYDDMLFNIVLAMLGIAGLRTYEKQKGLTK
jgi:hypothetical protein